MARTLVEAPRWLLLGSLILAPWAYGSTRPWAIEALSILTTTIWVLGSIECLVRHRWPVLPPVALLCCLGLIFQGWWMALNAHSSFDPGLHALWPRTSFAPGAPGSADGPASLASMASDTGLIGTFLFCCDLSRRVVWRKRIWTTIALTGASIALLGVLQKMGGDAILGWVWDPDKRDLTDNFATFRYRGNAGAYLNLIFPMMAGWTFLVFRKNHRPWRKAFSAVALFVLILGMQLNPSRASWFIGLILGLVLIGKIFMSNRTGEIHFSSKSAFVLMSALAFLSIVSICLVGNWETSWNRSIVLGLNPANRCPVEIYLRMVPDAGTMGFGPGTFETVFPSYQATYDFGDREVPQFWRNGFFAHAHEDYLETVIDWGYLGTLFWSILVLGGIARGAAGYFQNKTSISFRWLLSCSLLALTGVLIHASVDFPLQIASIQLYVLVLLGICWGARSASAVERTPAS